MHVTQKPETEFGSEVKFNLKHLGLQNIVWSQNEIVVADIKAHFNDFFFKNIRRFGNPALEFLITTEIETAQLMIVVPPIPW